MKLFSKPKPRLTAVLLALIIVAGGIPFVVGDHVNDMLSPWREIDDEPTGNSLLDDALATAANTLDSTLEHERIPRRDEPQVPATFFHDIFDPDDQIGRWDEWRPDDAGESGYSGFGGWTQETRWHLDSSGAGKQVQVPWVTPTGNQELQTHSYDIDQGYRFGDENGYPLPDLTPPSPGIAYSFLASPLINLQSLPVQLPDERADVPGSGNVDQAVNANGNGTVDLTQHASGARSSMDGHLDHQDRIILYMDHKYHFAQSQATTDQGGVFLLDGGGNLISGYLQPLRNSTAPNGFSGAQLNFTEEAFDLSSWAGQDVRIVYEVTTGGLDDERENARDLYFGDASKFQPGSNFFGWAVSNVRVEGPAHLHNVRLDRVTHPSVQNPDGGLFAPTGTEPLQVLLLNRGRMTEDVVVRMDIDGMDVGECADEVLVKGLEPGGSVVVDFVQDRSVSELQRIGCLDIGESDGFEARFEAEILARADDVVPRADLYTRDNGLVVDIIGQGPDVRQDGRLAVNPPLGPTNTPVTIDVPIVNHGASDVDVDLALSIDRRHPTASDFDEKDVHLNASLVRLADGTDADQSLHVPGTGQTSASWGFSAREPGLYRVTVAVTGPDGQDFFTANAVVGVLVAPEFAYETRFAGTPFDDDTVLRGDWGAESLLDPAPPCLPDAANACREDAVVWELDAKKRMVEGSDSDASNTLYYPWSALRAEFDPQDSASVAEHLPTSITDVEVRFLHHAQDIRCFPQWGGVRTCDIPIGSVASPSSSMSHSGEFPTNRMTVRLVENVETAATSNNFIMHQPGTNPASGRTQLSPPQQIQHMGGSHYRNAFYNSQWVEETHTIPVANLLGGEPSVPLGRLADVALEFVLDGGCMARTAQVLGCPTWRIAEVSVQGIPEDGQPIALSQWSGIRDEETRGTWYSYSVEGVGKTSAMYPNCLDDDRNEEALEENKLRCPIWSQRPVSDFAGSPPAATWHPDPAGFWTHGEESAGIYQYSEAEDGTVDVLTSPVFRVPDGDAPTARFEHRFQLHPYTDAGSQTQKMSPSAGDSGMVMVRFFDPEGNDPVTPYLPVYLEGGRFMRHDCQDYYASFPGSSAPHPVQHPDRANGCPPGLLGRSSVQDGFHLSDFPLLDYRDPSTAINPVTVGHGGANSGYGFRQDAQGDLVPSETGDVSNAFQRVDLRDCTAEGLPIPPDDPVPSDAKDCALQFAFRLEVPEPAAGFGGKANVRFTELADGAADAEGWFIDSFRIVKDDLTDFDLELVNARIDTEYKWEEVGLGPGTEATATLKVRNNGFFTVDKALFHVTVQDPLFGEEWRFEQTSDAEFVLEQDESTTITMPLELPPEDGNYLIMFGVDLLGDLIADEGIPLTDMEPANDCQYLLLDGGQRSTSMDRNESGCRSDVAKSVPVFRNPNLDMDLSITPEAGRTGEEFPREVDLRIENNGNSVVKDATLDVVLVRATEGATPEVHQWIVSESPLPGHAKSWTGMPLLDRQGVPSAALARIVLEEDGTYFVTAFLSPSQADRTDGHEWEVLQQVRLDAFDTIYADSFGSQRVEPDHPSMLSGEEMVPRDDNWTNVGAKIPDSDGDMHDARVWRFGNSETGQYPNSADASLELPDIDLSSARRATLSISHKYDLEPGYDGARVEASLDGGEQWFPLHPRGAYPGTVGAQNPLNAQNDPTTPAPAFTGDSVARNPGTDGWVIDEFDLANLPDFTTPVLLEQFNQEGFDGGPHVGSPNVQRPGDGPVTYHPSWSLPQTDCRGELETCWSRENANWQNPEPLQPGGQFLWAGPGGDSQVSLTLDDVTPLDNDQTARLRYTYWKDDAGRLTVEADGVPTVLLTPHTAGTAGGWVEGTLTVPRGALEADTFQVRVLFEGGLGGDVSNRGAAISEVVLDVMENQAGQAVVARSSVLLSDGQPGQDVPMEIGGWRQTDRAPSPPEAWGIDEVANRQGEEGLVWRFGTEYDTVDNLGRTTYPANATERLVTPRVDLRGVAGESASLDLWWQYELMPNDRRRVLIQTVEPTPSGGERLSEWQGLLSTGQRRSNPGEHLDCSDDVPAWCPVSIPISDYIGEVVRFAFEIQTTRLAPEPASLDAGGPRLGWTWMIDEVGIKADSLVGQPVQLRLRAATDSSINEGAWMVENVQLVGLTYESNVAVLPNETIRDRKLAPQEVIELSGLVRNLGPGPQRNIYLALSARANDEEVDLPEVRFLLDGDGEPEENVTGRIGPIFLGSAGASSDGELLDRIPYKLRVELPDAPINTQYRFKLEIQDEHGALLSDKNIGDHLREFQVDIKENAGYIVPGLEVTRPTLETGNETTHFVLPIDNVGSMRLAGTVHTNVTRLADASGAPVEEDPTLLAGVTVDEVMAGAQGAVEWEWTPGEDFEAGFYRVESTLEPSTPHGSQTHYAHVLVGSLPIYYVEDFAQNPFTDSQWTRGGPACNPAQTNCWRPSTVFQENGGQSLFIGDDASAGYPGHAAAQAATPGIDLSFLARDPADKESSIVTGQSPFKPFLSARYHPMLAGSDGVTVQARSGSDPFRTLLTGDRLGGRSNDMQVASFPLFEANNNVLAPSGGQNRLLKDDTSSFRFNTGAWSGGDGFGFALDLLTISSYDVEVDPPRHDVDLRLGSDKVFYFKVENTGAANDTYSIAINSEGTADIFQSPVTTVEVLTPQITLDPGGSSLAEVRVSIPFQRMPDKFSGTEIEVSVTSGVDPNRVATGVIHVEDFIEADLADLVTDLRRPRGESGPVVEGEQATFIASITNHGDRASRETDLVVFACPTHRLDEEGKKVREISLSECSKEGLAVEIGAVPLASLTPSKDAGPGSSDHVSTRTFSWVPPLGSRGEYQVVAVADPRQVVVQFDRSSSTDSLDLEVAPIERPDVVVTDLRVTDALGNEVRQASAGETLHIEGTVENLGDAPAPNVKARIVNQFNLRDERIGDLNPGASRILEAQWVAQPGNWVILFEGTTSAVEIDSSNNAKRWSLAVRSGTLQAHWDPGVVHVDPGATMDAVLGVDNHRDNPADLMVSVSADQFSLRGVPGSMTLARGASTEAEVAISASPFAHAGHHSIDVEFVQRDTGAVLASSSLEVHVGAERDVRLTVDPLHSPPGTASLPLTFTNGGDAAEAFTVRLDGPEDWTATVLQPSIRLEAGASREVQALLEIPPGTPAGRYELMLDSEVLQEVITVDVVKQPVWRSDVKSVHSLSDHVEVLVSVENVGNARAAPPFLAEETYSIDPTPRPHEPGEVRTYHLRIQTTDGVASVALPGHGEVPVELRPERPDVEMTRFEVQSSGVLQSGDRLTMRLQVRGDDAQAQLPLHLLVDGVRRTGERVDLDAGETQDVVLTWQADKPGKRVVTAVMGSGDATVARTIVLDFDHASDAMIPGPGPVVILALIGVVAVLRRRREP